MPEQTPKSEKKYWLEDPIWYTPRNVIGHYIEHIEKMPKEDQKGPGFKKARELFIATVFILGMKQRDSNNYLIQAVSDKEKSPDVRTGFSTYPSEGDKSPHFTTQDLEIVSFYPEDDEDICSFLKRTKLSKGYDPLTAVLCHIPNAVKLPSWREISECLREVGSDTPILILGKTSPELKNYILAQVNPGAKIIAEFNLESALLLEIDEVGVMHWTRGSKRKAEHSPKKYCPFEIAGLSCLKNDRRKI